MNDHRNHHSPGQHEVLSAYFDRETTREEAVEIERLLEHSPEARQMLDDFSDLSDMLHELPRHTLDASFADRVVQQTKSAGTAVEHVTISQPSHPSRFRWQVGLGLAAAAACVIVMVSGSLGRNGGVELAQRDQPAVKIGIGVDRTPDLAKWDEAVRNAIERDTSNALHPADDTGEKPLAMRGGAASEAARPNGAGAAPGAFGVAGESAKSKPVGAPTEPGSRIALSRDFDIRKVTAGEVVEALQTSGDDVSVVKLTVVDVQKGFKSVQLLLTNSIRNEETTKNGVADLRTLEKKDDAQSEEMWALFVQAPRDQMEDILAQIQKEPDIAGVRLEPAIAADSLNQLAPSALAQSRSGLASQRFVANGKDAQNRRLKEAIPERNAGSVPPATTQKKKADVAAKSDPLAKSFPPTPAAAPGAAVKQLGDESQNQMSRQLAVKLPMDAIEQSNRRNSVINQADRGPAAASRAAPAQDPKDGPTTVNKLVESSADDTLQVLIVFQQRPTPASEKARDRKPSSAPPVKKS